MTYNRSASVATAFRRARERENDCKHSLNNFEAWKEERNNKYPDDPIPEDLLETTNEEILSLWLSRYVVETRNSTGGRYPPSTIYQLLTALLRSMRESNANCLNFLERKNSNVAQNIELTFPSAP